MNCLHKCSGWPCTWFAINQTFRGTKPFYFLASLFSKQLTRQSIWCNLLILFDCLSYSIHRSKRYSKWIFVLPLHTAEDILTGLWARTLPIWRISSISHPLPVSTAPPLSQSLHRLTNLAAAAPICIQWCSRGQNGARLISRTAPLCATLATLLQWIIAGHADCFPAGLPSGERGYNGCLPLSVSERFAVYVRRSWKMSYIHNDNASAVRNDWMATTLHSLKWFVQWSAPLAVKTTRYSVVSVF